MEINVTAIERWVRQLAMPVAVILVGLVFVWAASKLEGLFGAPAVGCAGGRGKGGTERE